MSKSYMPSNGSEGIAFESEFCNKCFNDKAGFTQDPNDKSCGILASAYFGEQPKEWIIKDDCPTCTAFIKYDWKKSIENQKEKEGEVIDEPDPNQLALSL